MNGRRWVLLGTVVAGLVGAPQNALSDTLNFDIIRGACVQYEGRYQPLDTAARDVIRTITGSQNFNGQDPVGLLLGWTFEPIVWMSEPLISISNAELRRELRLSSTQTVFSYNELISHNYLHHLINALRQRNSDRKMDPLDSKVSKINGQLALLQSVFAGQVIRPIPDANDPVGEWGLIGQQNHDHSNAAVGGVQDDWESVKQAYLASDTSRFEAASVDLVAGLNALPAAFRPSDSLLATELRFNKLHPFRMAWMVMLAGAFASLVSALVRKRWINILSVGIMICGFGLLTYGLALRWSIAGRIPAANMFESLLFISWGTGAAAILGAVFLRHRSIPLIASSMGAIALILADCLPVDSFIRPIAPVLMDTVWMSIHVPIIMISYSVLAIAVLVAHAQVGLMAIAPSRTGAIHQVDVMHHWLVQAGSILLFAGIATGSMWAASSWGRYWGWDPKEVWSLVAFLGYMAILHVRINHERVPVWAYGVGALLTAGVFTVVAQRLAPITTMKAFALGGTLVTFVLFVLAHGQFATVLKSILAFWLIIMTYIGVNYVLGIGLHSYGFGTGAAVRYMLLLGGIDLGVVCLFSIVYLVRRPRQSHSLNAAIAVPA